MTLALRYAVRSDVGLLREGNEDSAYAGPHLLAIADGMGGHAAGEVASAVAISALAPLDEEVPGLDMLGALADAVAKANARLHDMSAADPSMEGMGTTLTAMLWSGARMALVHIGDSRAYLLRERNFYQITRDHTLVQSLLDDGRINADEAAIHPQRSLILRALDSRTDAEPDLSLREAQAGDRYLLCSDGLTDVVTEETLHRTLLAIDDPAEAVIQLIDLANRAGGPDNITCIVADVIDSATALKPPTEVSVVAGAVSNQGGRPMARADTPATRAHRLTQPPPSEFDGHEPGSLNGNLDDGDEEDHGRGYRRRWPIVTTILVVLVVVILGGGFAAWNYTQHQYYVGEDSGQVVIFRGVNVKLAGISMSKVYKRTGIPIDQVTTDDRSQLSSTITASSLTDANTIVTNIRTAANKCQADFQAQQNYQTAKSNYQKALNAYNAAKRKHRKVGKPPVAPAQPAPVPPICPQAANSGGTGTSTGSPAPPSGSSSSGSSSP
jgi:serine/threonine protein phosphatase PrpC